MIATEDIKGLFKNELAIIQDSDVRNKVIEAWVKGCEMGGWDSVDELHQMPFTLLTDTHGVSFIEHTKVVTWGAYHLAQAQERNYEELPYAIDYDRLIAGGLLHDVGKLMEIQFVKEGEYRKSYAGKCARHPISGAILAAQVGLSEEIVNTIACHAKEGEGRPQFVETVFIHQADYATFNPLVMKEKGTLIGE
jgi:putative nucleotidyltransferase with HDIG domain